MQTFLPYPSLHRSAACLDTRRLGKQRVEAFQIIRALSGQSTGWRRHPATLMWAGYERGLLVYQRACILEWIARGHRNTMVVPEADDAAPLPWWFGEERLHSSHRASLLRKNPTYYGEFGWADDLTQPYWWPTHKIVTNRCGQLVGG
jgi:hypothetical protein